jgi:hypothetical protein
MFILTLILEAVYNAQLAIPYINNNFIGLTGYYFFMTLYIQNQGHFSNFLVSVHKLKLGLSFVLLGHSRGRARVGRRTLFQHATVSLI